MENYLSMNPMAYRFTDFYNRWSLVHAIMMVLFTFISIITDSILFLVILTFISFTYYIIKIPTFIPKLPLKLGYANLITCLRLGLIISIGLFYNHLTQEILFIWFLFIILLDGVDGVLARRFNHSTKAGEILDMETDSFMVLVLSFIHFDYSVLGWWILIPGSLRYFNELIVYWLKDIDQDYPPKKVRSTIAVVFFIALLIPFIISGTVVNIVAAIAGLLIIYSFGSSILFKLKATVRS